MWYPCSYICLERASDVVSMFIHIWKYLKPSKLTIQLNKVIYIYLPIGYCLSAMSVGSSFFPRCRKYDWQISIWSWRPWMLPISKWKGSSNNRLLAMKVSSFNIPYSCSVSASTEKSFKYITFSALDKSSYTWQVQLQVHNRENQFFQLSYYVSWLRAALRAQSQGFP